MDDGNNGLTRRQFLQYTLAWSLLAGLGNIVPAYARQLDGAVFPGSYQAPDVFNLFIRKKIVRIGGRDGTALTVNGTVPGPLLRFREGQTVTLQVMNELEEDTSVHWHGVILPAPMDGVPGVSFPGIRPDERFTYRFTPAQSGTYWYHSHTEFQEQMGHYGPLIIDPVEPEPYRYDREHVVMLSDWTFEDPHTILSNLKKQSDYYNFQQLTARDFLRDASRMGWRKTLEHRLAWGRMKMDPTDIADITGYTYTYLVNGLPPEANWTGMFLAGERVRLRIINGSSMTYFNVRIPGLRMTVVQADGQNIAPITVDEFQIAAAETYDVIIQPKEDKAYTIFAESMDRSGYARGTLAPREGMSAPVPGLRPRPLLTMADMGMAHNGEGNAHDGAVNGAAAGNAGSGHEGHGEAAHGSEHGDHGEAAHDTKHGAGHGAQDHSMEMHGPDHHGPSNAMVAMMPKSRLHEPGTGLENVGHRVLAYTDLRNLNPGYDPREPGREIEMHITGNMERYMWSIDGKKYSEAEPIHFRYGERLRITLVNDTMMNHPFHLHGMWMELDNGAGAYKPRKHTINVKPGEKLSFDVTADAEGNWAFHCHLLYHMHLGMFRMVTVTRDEGGAHREGD